MSRPKGAAPWLVAVLWSSTTLSHPLYGAYVAGHNAADPPGSKRFGNCCGLLRLQSLLSAEDESKRIAGYLRVQAHDDDESWRLLADQLSRTNIERSPAEDLALARVFAPNVRKALVQPLVARLAFDTNARLDPAEPLRLLAMQTCVWSLAWANSTAALITLGRTLKTEGALSVASQQALLAHPPKPFSRLFSPAVARSPAWAKLLGLSQRVEAIPILRRVLLEGLEEMQLAAADALVALGDRAMEPLLEQWSRDARAPEAFRQLARHRARQAATNTVRDGPAWPIAPESKTILEWVRSPGSVADRLYGSRDNRQQHQLMTALLLCSFSQCIAPHIAPAWLKATMAEKRSSLGFAAAALLSKIEPAALVPQLRRRDTTVERAVSWSLPYLASDSPLLGVVAEILNREDPSRSTSLLCSGLLHERIHRTMATAWLLTMAHGDGACAPLAAEALATRDGIELRDALRRLLWTAHPLMRAAVARGLANSLAPSSSGLLVARFALEDEQRVRRAIVRSLGRRHSGLGRQLLLDAARFDADALVRSFALRGSHGELPQTQPGDPLGFGLGGSEGGGVASLVLSIWHPSDSPLKPDGVAILSGPDGGSMPVVTDPTGLVLVPMAKDTLLLEPYANSDNPSAQNLR